MKQWKIGDKGSLLTKYSSYYSTQQTPKLF